jgi:hypothetical protein
VPWTVATWCTVPSALLLVWETPLNVTSKVPGASVHGFRPSSCRVPAKWVVSTVVAEAGAGGRGQHRGAEDGHRRSPLDGSLPWVPMAGREPCRRGRMIHAVPPCWVSPER